MDRRVDGPPGENPNAGKLVGNISKEDVAVIAKKAWMSECLTEDMDNFQLLGYLPFLCIPLALLFRRLRKGQPGDLTMAKV